MTTFDRLINTLRARAVSPDNSIVATLTWIDGVSVTCRPGTLRYHSATSFARQVELVLADLASNSDLRRKPLDGEPLHSRPDYLAEATATPRLDEVATSPRGLVRVWLSGSTGYRIEVAKTIGSFGESAVTEEMNAALHSVNERFAARSAALPATAAQHTPAGSHATAGDVR